MLNSVLFISSLFLIVCLLLPVQLYGSTILCDPSLNLTNLTNCDEGSSSTSSTLDTETTDNSRSDTETPLIVPDISPTGKDLEDATTDVDRGTTVTGANNDDDDENPDDDGDSSRNEDGSSDSDTSLIPFP